MKPPRFVLLYLPLIALFHLVSCGFIFKILNQYTPYDPSTIIYQKTVVLGLVFPAVVYIVGFCHDLFTMGMNGNTESVGFNRFYFPLLEEALKLGFLYVLSSMAPLNFKQLAIFIFVYNTLCVYKLVESYSPYYYAMKFQKFLHLYDIWLNQDIYKKKYSYQSRKDMEKLFNSFKAGNGPEEYDSITSCRLEDTLINTRFSIFNLPPTFNIKDLDQNDITGIGTSNISKKSDVPPHAVKSLPLVHSESGASENTLSTMSSSRKIINFNSCYDFVDKLYSVSPKNTYHLNTATALAASDPISIDQDLEIQNDDSIEVDPLTEVSLTNNNIDEGEVEDDTHFGGGGGGGFRFKTPGGTDIDFSVGGGFDFVHGRKNSEDRTGKSLNKQLPSGRRISSVYPQSLHIFHSALYTLNASGVSAYDTGIAEPHYCSNKFISVLNWFSWLFPPLLPVKNCSRISHKLSKNEQFPLLKQKLSTYNMEKAFSILESSLYGSLENLDFTPFNSTKLSGNYEKFKYFVGYYFDYNLDSNNQLICIDPCFKRFGKTIEELSPSLLIFDSINTLIWNSLVFVVLGNILMNYDSDGLMNYKVSVFLLIITIVLKLFRMNYLNCSEISLNLKLIIASESLINLFIMTLFGVLLVTK